MTIKSIFMAGLPLNRRASYSREDDDVEDIYTYGDGIRVRMKDGKSLYLQGSFLIEELP